MAIVTNSIGTSSRDYSTIALWEAALPASAVTAGNSYVGQCYADSEFDLVGTMTTIGGTTTDATHTITLTTGPGQGFKDNAGAATNALRYNASNGAAIKGSIGYSYLFTVTDNYVTVSNLQFLNSNGVAHGCFTVTGTNFEIDNCILQSAVRATAQAQILSLQSANANAKNCLIISDSSNGSAYGILIANTGSLINCNVVRPSDKTASTTIGIGNQYQANTIQNCAVAGFGTAIVQNGAHVLSGSGNAIDGASYPGSLTGQVSLTIATEFVQPSNASSVMDWRLNATAVKCNQTGTNSGAPATDIIGTTRPQGTNVCVGVWELPVSSGTRGLFFNSTLSLGAGGSFFADRLAT